MNVRTVIMVVAATLWLTITGLTLYVLIEEGPDILILVSLIVLATLGIGIFGALNERRGGPR